MLWPRLLTREQTATYVGVWPTAVDYMLREGHLHRVSLPYSNRPVQRKILIDREEIDALIERYKREPGRPFESARPTTYKTRKSS